MNEKFDPAYDAEQKQNHFDQLPAAQKEQAVNFFHEEALERKAPTLKELLSNLNSEVLKSDIEKADKIAEAVAAEGGLALIVGGFARDTVMQKFGADVHPKDIDLEVYNLDFEKLKALLGGFGRIDIVGAAFGVIKLGNLDISIPRRDSKSGRGHKGFVIEGDPTMTVKEAARRRDFTFNALAINPMTGEVIDHYGGIEDIKNKKIRATDPELFGDDPLRALRAAQFAGRFEFEIEKDTVELARNMDLLELPKERIGEEWVKLLLKAKNPSYGLEAARELGILEKLHPEINALIGCEQEPEWHPEGDVWTHTKMVVDSAAKITRECKLENQEQLILMLSAICHDLGKPATTEVDHRGRITSKGHSEAGIEPTIGLLKSWNIPMYIIEIVKNLVKEHLYPSLNKDANASAIRRLANRLHPANIRQLVYLAQADHMGRALPWDGFPEGNALLKKSAELDVENAKPVKILRGRDLIQLGMSPGKALGNVLNQLYELQLEGAFLTHEEGIEIAKKKLG